MHHLTFTKLSTLILSCFLLLSFSIGNTVPPIEQAPPQTKRFQKKRARLERRLARAQRPAQQLRLQKKIQRLQHDHPNRTLSILSLIIGVLAAATFLVTYAFPTGAFIAFILAIASIGLAIAGLVMSISALLLIRHSDGHFGGNGFAIVGLVLSGLIIGIVMAGISMTVFLL